MKDKLVLILLFSYGLGHVCSNVPSSDLTWNECNPVFKDPSVSIKCDPTDTNTVCAGSPGSLQTYQNWCTACSAKVSGWYVGSCSALWTKCTLDPATVKCSNEKAPVCGTDCNQQNLVQYQNACIACISGAFGYFVDASKCTPPPPPPPPPEPTEGVCDHSISPAVILCPATEKPVCGYFFPHHCQTGQPTYQTYLNSCMACIDPKVQNWKLGPCPTPPPPPPPPPEPTSGVCDPLTKAFCVPGLIKPVCGLFKPHIQCIRAPCGRDFDNACLACQDPDIHSWQLGPCNPPPPPPPPPPPQPSSGSCCVPRPDTCIIDAKETCGIVIVNQAAYGIQYNNDCFACQDKRVQAWFHGKCNLPAPPRTGGVCTSRPQACTLEYVNTCGVIIINGQRYGKQYGNDCVACSDVQVSEWYYGDCGLPTPPPPPPPPPTSGTCPAERPQACTREYIQTCGVVIINGVKYGKPFGNQCSACADPTVVEWYYGHCIHPAPPAISQCSNPRPETCITVVQPACGIINVDGVLYGQSFSNECFACMDKRVSEWHPGTCVFPTLPQGTCPAQRPQVCTMQYQKTCGVIVLNGVRYGKQYGNDCSACSDWDVVEWFAGDCNLPEPPVRQGVCNLPRPATCDLFAPQIRVCGMTNRCQNPPCGQFYQSSCHACWDKSIDYWYIGNQCNFAPVPITNGRCTDPRPNPESRECRTNLKNVCGVFNDNVKCLKQPCPYGQQYGNGCQACSDPNVKEWYDGQCQNEVQQTTQGFLGSSAPAPGPASYQPSELCPQDKSRICSFTGTVETCGLFGGGVVCAKYPCGQQFENPCKACSDDRVFAYFLGKCAP